MKEIYKSTSKLVFFLLAIGASIFTYKGVVSGEQYMTLVTMAFMAYYQRQKEDDRLNNL